MLIFLLLQYWDIDNPLAGCLKIILCHCFFDRNIFFIDVPPMSCYNNAIFYRTIETIHRWIVRTDTLNLGYNFVNEEIGNIHVQPSLGLKASGFPYKPKFFPKNETSLKKTN